MNSQDSQQNFYDPKTLAVMDRAFAILARRTKFAAFLAVTAISFCWFIR
jgi:hypothetical protein